MLHHVAFYGGVFLVTAATLMLQLIQTRILSVVAWYHLAFFVISIAMFGLTAGAVWVYLRRERFTEKTLSHDLVYFTSAFALTTVLAFAVQLTLPPLTEATVLSVVVWAELTIVLAIPFFFSGVVVSLFLTRSPYPIGRVYGVDLVGAAIGCLGVLLVLDAVRGPTAVLAVAAMAAAAAILFSLSRVGGAPAKRLPLQAVLKRPVALTLVLLAAAFLNDRAGHAGLHPLFVKGQVERLHDRIFEEWNSFSRVVVFRTHNEPHMWGPSPHFNPADWPHEQLGMNIDGAAGTTMYRVGDDIEDVAFFRYDVTTLPYFIPGLERGVVIGVGGGRDLLSARLFGLREIIGIEINPILRRLLVSEPGFAEFSRIGERPGITIEVDEARSWLARARDRFDIIQMSLVDTWAATGAGAYSLSENGLYTVEAWRMFLDRLNPDGVFTVSRWYAPTRPEETGRLISLAMAALFEDGATEPRQHIFLASSGSVATLVIARQPLSAAALEALETASRDMAYTVLLTPRATPDVAILGEIAAAGTREALEAYTAGLVLDLAPPTDDRPFFFNQLPLYNPIQTLELALWTGSEAGVVLGNLFATATLVILFTISLVLVLATIIIPLRPAIRDVGGRLAWGGTAYFFLIGMGFMMVEIGLLQRMSVFLGHPIYALSIVLFSIILTTGFGAIISDKLPLDSPSRLIAWASVTGAYLYALPHWLPQLLLAMDSASLFMRAALSVVVIAPAGLLMGFGFPTGMRLISAVDRRPTPWFWGINGAAGVLAASLAIAVSIAIGISTTFLIGAICYVLLIPAALVIGFSANRAVEAAWAATPTVVEASVRAARST